jgi:hypothetical protein
MNSPKEKAKELVDKYCAYHFEQKRGSIIIDLEKAKQCALIAVKFAQERVNDVADHIFLDSTDATNEELEYLEEVKQEILKS